MHLLAALTGLTAFILVAPAFAEVAVPAVTPMLTNGPGNNCAENYYPAAAIAANEEGATELNIHVDAMGRPTGVDIVTSSGFADLDQASRDCVTKGWHFTPAMKNGKPIASTKEFRIVWKLLAPPPKPKIATLMAGPGNNCAARYYPQSAIANHEEGKTTIDISIDAEGNPTKVDIVNSSGSDALDAAAIRCVMAGWHFKPATAADGTAIAGSRTYGIVWGLHTF